MIDFNKPLRVVDNPMSVIREPNDGTRLMSIDGRLCVIAWHGNVYRLEPMNVIVENVPSEPKKRYQAQFAQGCAGNWYTYKQYSPDNCPVIAWLVETDHGEDAPHSDGYTCGTHICSSEEWMKTDLGIKKGSAPYRHEELRKMSPHGYVMEFVSLHDVPTHAALQAAIAKARK